MKRPRHIAVAIDFSEHSLAAARLAFGMARAWDTSLTLIHAYEPFGSHYPGSAALLPELIVEQIEQSNRERALEQLTTLRTTLEDGLPASELPKIWVTAISGKPSEAICSAALEAAAELLVIGSRGKSQLTSWLLGSVVRDVAASAHCPVLVTRGRHDASWHEGFSQITVGVDHTELTRPLVDASSSLRDIDGRLALVKVWNVPVFDERDVIGAGLHATVSALNAEAMAWEADRLDKLREAAGLSAEQASLRVELGKSAEQLLAHAKSSKADLIALGSHARDNVLDRILGTTAERVLRHSEVPVLMFPITALPAARTHVSGEMAEFHELGAGDCKSYLIVSASREGMLVDPLLEDVESIIDLVSGRTIELKYVVDTHVHADHISGAPRLAEKTGATYVVHKNSGSSCAGMRVEHGERLELGRLSARVIYTPGHAADAISLAFPDRLLTGDFLFIGAAGAGRTDLPGGDSGEHWDALRELRHLEPSTLIYPGHDYHGLTFSTLAEERINNPRLKARSREEYVKWLDSFDLGSAEWMVDVVAANQLLVQANDGRRRPACLFSRECNLRSRWHRR